MIWANWLVALVAMVNQSPAPFSLPYEPWPVTSPGIGKKEKIRSGATQSAAKVYSTPMMSTRIFSDTCGVQNSTKQSWALEQMDQLFFRTCFSDFTAAEHFRLLKLSQNKGAAEARVVLASHLKAPWSVHPRRKPSDLIMNKTSMCWKPSNGFKRRSITILSTKTGK